MSITEQLSSLFSETLAIPVSQVTDDLAFNSIPQWDSVAHMVLVSAIESAFDIMIDADDVVDMSTFAKAREIVAKYLASA